MRTVFSHKYSSRRTLLFLSFFLSFLLWHTSCIRANIWIYVYTHEYGYRCMYTHSFFWYHLPFSTSDFIILSPTPVRLQCIAVYCSISQLSNIIILISHPTSSSLVSPQCACSILQHVTACCSMLQRVTALHYHHPFFAFDFIIRFLIPMCCSMLLYVAVCCSTWQYLAVCMLLDTLCCNMLQ